jgi:hypothetical protein
MAYTIDNIEISKARAALTEYGVWSVRADLVGGKAPARGARVVVGLGDLQLSGTVRLADVYVERAEVLVVAGADGWSKNVKQRPYRSDNGVRLSLVAGDLARDVGETLGPLGSLETQVLGYGWVRPAGLASTALSELWKPWYVDIDGTTRLGERQRVQRSGLRLGVLGYTPSLRRVELTTPDDRFSSFVPGSVISGEGIPQLRVRAVSVHVQDQSAWVEVEHA